MLGQAVRGQALSRRLFTFLLAVAALVLAFSVAPSNAQDVDSDDVAPPPRLLSKDERTRLDAEQDVKRRTKLALDLMNSRMTSAEGLHDKHEYDAMFTELGAFHGLVDDTMVFLNKSDKDSRKVLDNFKRFEIALRSFTPRIELIRRDLPLRYEFYVRTLAIFIRNARAKAVDPLFSDTVIDPKKPQH